MTEEAKKKLINDFASKGITLGEAFEIHKKLYDDGFRLKVNSYSSYRLFENDEFIELKQYENTLSIKGKVFGKFWFCPDYEICDRNIMSLIAEDYSR